MLTEAFHKDAYGVQRKENDGDQRRENREIMGRKVPESEHTLLLFP
jgi:hypothetical protein